MLDWSRDHSDSAGVSNRAGDGCRNDGQSAAPATYLSPMALVNTTAIVLSALRYSETSKIVRLATRDLGVQSAIAKGALEGGTL